MKLRQNQHPGGHKEGRAFFPIQSQYKDSKIHSSNPTLEEKGRKNKEERERGAWWRGRLLLVPGQRREREREREERVGERYLSPLTLELKD